MHLPQTIAHIPVGLAPMEGVTDFALRMWMRFASSPDFLCTPFLRVTETFPARGIPPAFLPEAGFGGTPTLPQLMASRSKDFLRVAEQVLRESSTIELNCGCPAPNAVGSGAGSSILATPSLFSSTLHELQAALGPAFAVKMRSGFATDFHFTELLAGFADLDLARLTLHARTKDQGYKGRARWDLVDDASRRSQTPVFASGDVVDYKSYCSLLKEAPYIQGLVIGRGALRNPWIFKELRDKRAVQMTSETMVMSLGCLALLLQAHHTDAARLYAWSKDLVRYEAGTDLSAWRNLYQSLARLLGQRASRVIPEPELDAFALGRIKMIWGSMRSSLAPPWFAPQIFRIRNGADFFAALASMASPNEDLCWLHNPSHDWLYSGGGKPTTAQQA